MTDKLSGQPIKAANQIQKEFKSKTMVIMDSITRNSVQNLSSDLEKSVKKDLEILKKHGML